VTNLADVTVASGDDLKLLDREKFTELLGVDLVVASGDDLKLLDRGTSDNHFRRNLNGQQQHPRSISPMSDKELRACNAGRPCLTSHTILYHSRTRRCCS
jgi:hypothetical protein